MKTVIILHGMPSKEEYLAQDSRAANQHWIPWLQGQLNAAGFDAQAPEMPEPYDPDYQKWSQVFEQYSLDTETVLVGHSCGGGFLVRWLSEHKDKKVGKVILVAPWIDPNGKFAPKMFGDMKIDGDLVSRTGGIVEFISTDDDQEELETLNILQSNIKSLQVREFNDRGHFIFQHMKTNEFPELRDEILSPSS